jgi:RNA polymerase sigma-70 factor (ECF subfamily)
MDPRPGTDHRREARYRALVDQVGKPLARYLGRRTDPEEARDVWADALLVLWRRLDDVPADAALPWAYGVARRCLANARRARTRRLALVRRVGAQREQQAGLDGRPSTEQQPGEASDPELTDALSHLSEADQELLRLSAWEDLAPAQIAVVLGTTPNAVSIRLHRARQRLREELEARGRPRKIDTTSAHRSSGHTKEETA